MMNLSNYIDTRFPEHKDKIYEFLRFCIVGTIAAGIHYGIYCLLQMYIEVNIAYTVGYLTSLVCNFFLTSYITFGQESRRIRTEPSGELLAAHIPVQRILADRRATTHCPYLCTDDSRTYQLRTAAMGVQAQK